MQLQRYRTTGLTLPCLLPCNRAATSPPKGREPDDLIGRGYVEVKGEVAARLLRGERVTLPVALLDLGRAAARAFAGTGAMKLRALPSGRDRLCGGGGAAAPFPANNLTGATVQLLAMRGGGGGGGSSMVTTIGANGGVYGKSDLEVLVELLLLDCAAVEVVPVSLLGLGGGITNKGGAGGRSGHRGSGPEGQEQEGGCGLMRTPSTALQEPSECALLVLVSAAEGLPLVKRSVPFCRM
jgi:hypothetical protein